jgi:hypothetical protein
MSPTAIAPTPRQDDAPAILVPSENLQPTIRPTTAATAGPAVSRRAGHPFAELLDRGQPVRILRKRGAAHRKLNILEVAVSTGRGSLESSEAVKAGDFAQGPECINGLSAR